MSFRIKMKELFGVVKEEATGSGVRANFVEGSNTEEISLQRNNGDGTKTTLTVSQPKQGRADPTVSRFSETDEGYVAGCGESRRTPALEALIAVKRSIGGSEPK